jgi:ABC-type dipeptide/oligopeptide/nickel transport system ATPase component
MPETTNNGTLTFVIGYSGAGKSTAIGDAESIPNTPYQVTSDNKLVLDSDNIQPFIPGYAGGVGSQNTSAYAIAAYRKFLESAMAQKKDIVVPIVGGQIDTVVAEIVKAILNDYKVKVQLVNTPAHVSYHNAITRAAMDGKRVFTPIVGPNSNPSRVYETLSGKSAKDESMDETENIAGLQIIENKIKKEILERLGGKKKADPIQQKSLEDKYKNLDQLVTFELIRGPQEPIYNVASNKLKLIKIAAKFEKNNQHFIADALLRVLFKI